MRETHAFCVVLIILLVTSYSSNAFAYWPIVFQIPKDGSDFATIHGPLQIKDSGLVVDTSLRLAETVASYKFVFREYVSFSEDVLKAMKVYLQIYPADARAPVYGTTGDIFFNGEKIKDFYLNSGYPEEGFFFDASNYRFTKSVLDFPIPMYAYLSDRSLFVSVPVSLLDTNINVTFRMDPGVLWEIYVTSVIVRIIPEEVSPWWQKNLPLVYGIVSAELFGSVLITLRFRNFVQKRRRFSHESAE